jgi:hypothetical protein
MRIWKILAVLAFGVFAVPAMADDLYTVSGIHVDANGASSSEALNSAIAQGRAKAFQTLFRRMAKQADWAKQPALDANGLTRISRGFTIANERRSTTRYVADVTYMFNPDAVARTLRSAAIAYSQTTAKKILVIPMSPNVTHGPWAQALLSPSLRDSVVPFVVSGAEDDAALAALNFESATWSDVGQVAMKSRITEVALVQAVYANGHLTVNIRRLGLGETPARGSVDVPLLQTVGTTYPAAAQAAVRAIEDLWKTRSAIDYSQRGRLTVDVRIASLAQWGALQGQLATVANVTGVTVTAMTTNYARISIAYLGGIDQLREAMGGAGLALTARGGGQWMLANASQ